MPAYDASDTPVPPAQFTGFVPSYDPPGLSIRATFLATDGSRPQELIMEWKTDPGMAVLDFALNAISDMARPSEVNIQVETPDGRAEVETRMEQIQRAGRASGTRRTEGPFHGREQAADSVPLMPARELPVVCNAEGPGHFHRDGHGCAMSPDHDPVEPEGRAHRCACGGIFGTDTEHPVVDGRSTQSRRRRREDG